MTVQFTCDCCGRTETVPEIPDEAIQAPAGWRRIKTVIDEFDGEDRTFNTWESEYVHSCDECNVHMSVDEHLEAEVESRRRAMNG